MQPWGLFGVQPLMSTGFTFYLRRELATRRHYTHIPAPTSHPAFYAPAAVSSFPFRAHPSVSPGVLECLTSPTLLFTRPGARGSAKCCHKELSSEGLGAPSPGRRGGGCEDEFLPTFPRCTITAPVPLTCAGHRAEPFTVLLSFYRPNTSLSRY